MIESALQGKEGKKGREGEKTERRRGLSGVLVLALEKGLLLISQVIKKSS